MSKFQIYITTEPIDTNIKDDVRKYMFHISYFCQDNIHYKTHAIVSIKAGTLILKFVGRLVVSLANDILFTFSESATL